MNEQITDAPSDDYFNELAKAVFQEHVGRPHPWEGVQHWVICAMRDAHVSGQQSAHARYAGSGEAQPKVPDHSILLKQARRVRNYSNPAEVFDAIPVTALSAQEQEQTK